MKKFLLFVGLILTAFFVFVVLKGSDIEDDKKEKS